MKTRTTWTTSLTRAGNLRVNTSVKVPMLPTMRSSTTVPTVLSTSSPKRKRRKKR